MHTHFTYTTSRVRGSALKSLSLTAHSECSTVNGEERQTATTLSVLMDVKSSGACKSGGLSTGAIVGIAVGGGVILLALLIVIVILIGLHFNQSWAKRLTTKRRPKKLTNRAIYA